MKIVGLTIESVGPEAKLNDLCRIVLDEEKQTVLMAEVVGFRDKRILLMPLDSTEGLELWEMVKDREAWHAAGYWIVKRQTLLSD